MAEHLVDDAISLFDKFSDAVSPDVLKDLIENARWKESLQRFCDTEHDCVLKIAWSMIEMCNSSNNVTEFENLDLHTPVWPERNSLAPFCRHEAEANEALGTTATTSIGETIPQTAINSADPNEDASIGEKGRSELANPVSFASTILTSQSTTPNPSVTDSHTPHIDLSSREGNQNLNLDSALGLDNGSSTEETPLQERTPRQDITMRQRSSSIRRMNRSVSSSEPVSSLVGTPDQSVIHETNTIDVLLAACELQRAGTETQHAPTDVATDESSPMSTPPAFEAAPSPFFSSPSSYSSVSTSTREEFRPNQPTESAIAYQEGEPETPISCQVNTEAYGAVEDLSNDSNGRVIETTAYSPQNPHFSPRSSDVQDDVSRPSTPESLTDDLVSPRDTAEPLLPCIQVNTETPSPTPECTSIGVMRVSPALTVNETPSPSAVSDGLSPDPSESSMTPRSKLDESIHVEKSEFAHEPLPVFINNAVDTIRGLSQNHTEGPSEDDQILVRDLKAKCINTNWSNGANWLRCIEKGDDSRQRLNVSHMITFAAFARWYDSQVAEVQRRKPDTPNKTASNEVMKRLMTHMTSPTTSNKIASTARSSLRTRLTKGRRLLDLIERFGFGVVFVKRTW
ncbi:hypothetical protein CCHR01_18542 [Colletotrichum chrysophilum]|uniref:Uncharacterized protein n=1 Tax=Colletotrichum chrysophilum TaxID=1836956 RepID=A0AAD9E836_9PEZI|nr:hypothetical protein CCHR01_18542 [Colletotrichum chrysophilum]